MADLKLCVDFVLRQEDSLLSGKVTTIPGDSGGVTRFGLASRWHPELVASGFFDVVKTPRDAALAIAEEVYAKVYAAPMCVAAITDEALAAAVLSLGVNAGDPESAKLLQGACVSFGKPIAVDGHMGPASIAAVNSINADALLALFCVKVKNFYVDLVVTHPQDAGDLKGWMNRVDAWQASAASLRAQAAAQAKE
jgi:type VI secretion system secreted protein VgrG